MARVGEDASRFSLLSGCSPWSFKEGDLVAVPRSSGKVAVAKIRSIDSNGNFVLLVEENGALKTMLPSTVFKINFDNQLTAAVTVGGDARLFQVHQMFTSSCFVQGEFVGVMRTDGRLTIGKILQEFEDGSFSVLLDTIGSRKSVSLPYLRKIDANLAQYHSQTAVEFPSSHYLDQQIPARMEKKESNVQKIREQICVGNDARGLPLVKAPRDMVINVGDFVVITRSDGRMTVAEIQLIEDDGYYTIVVDKSLGSKKVHYSQLYLLEASNKFRSRKCQVPGIAPLGLGVVDKTESPHRTSGEKGLESLYLGEKLTTLHHLNRCASLNQATLRPGLIDADCALLCESIYNPNPDLRTKTFVESGFDVLCDCVESEIGKAFSAKYMIGLDSTRSCLILVFRGTEFFEFTDWCTNSYFNPVAPIPTVSPGADGYKVHGGIWTTLQDSIEMILHDMDVALQRHPAVSTIVITGHSLGGAYAMLTRLHWVIHQDYLRSNHPHLSSAAGKVQVVTFGAPLVFSVKEGDAELALAAIQIQLHQEARCYVTPVDVVPRLLGSKPEGSWEAMITESSQQPKVIKNVAGLAAAGIGAVALTCATGGIATAIALAAAAGCAKNALVSCALTEAQKQFTRLSQSSEVKSYVSVGTFIFLRRTEDWTQEVALELSGPSAQEELCVPKARSDIIEAMLTDHKISLYKDLLHSKKGDKPVSA